MRPGSGITCRPKDRSAQRQSIAFLEKCAKEKEKLQERLTEELKTDILRMFEDSIHPDILFYVGKKEVRAHKIMLQGREGDIYNYLLDYLANDNNSASDVITSKELKDFLRQLYTTECCDILVEEFIKKLISEDLKNDSSSLFPVVNGNEEIDENNDPDLKKSTYKITSHIPVFSCVRSRESSGPEAASSADSCMSFSSASTSSLGNNNGSFTSLSLSSSKDEDYSQASTLSPEDRRQQMNEIRQPSFVNCDTVSGGPTSSEEAPPVKGLLASQRLPDLITASTTLPHEPCCKLGRHLLQILLQGTNTDCILSVHNHDFRAHKCILACRSKYFDTMFNGSWAETDAEKLHLESISSVVLEQLLLYLYGGVIDLIDNCDMVELLVIADMYGIDGLKDAVNFNLRYDRCHFFHRPCPGCIAGVPEVLALSKTFNMAELHERCLKWINKNFSKVWPTKSFSLMHDSLMMECCQRAIKDLTCENVLEVIMDCQKISSSLPRLKWSEPVLAVVTQLMDAAIEFTGLHFTEVISSKHFMSLDQVMAWSMSLLDDVFTMVIKSLPMEKACRTYLSLNRLIMHLQEEDCVSTEDFATFVRSLFNKCEDYLKLHIHQVAHCKDWDLLTDEMQKNIMQSASYVCIDNSNRGKMPPKLTSMQKRRSGAEMIKLIKEDGTYMMSSPESSPSAKGSPKIHKALKNSHVSSGSPVHTRIPTPKGSPSTRGNNQLKMSGGEALSHKKAKTSKIAKRTHKPQPDEEVDEVLTISIVELTPESDKDKPTWFVANRQQNINLLKRVNSSYEPLTAEAALVQARPRSQSMGQVEHRVLKVARKHNSYLTSMYDNKRTQIIPIFNVVFFKPDS